MQPQLLPAGLFKSLKIFFRIKQVPRLLIFQAEYTNSLKYLPNSHIQSIEKYKKFPVSGDQISRFSFLGFGQQFILILMSLSITNWLFKNV